MTRDPVLLRALELQRWDDFLARLPHIGKNAGQLLGAAMTMHAPLRVIKHLVLEKHVDVNEPFMHKQGPVRPLFTAMGHLDVETALFLLDHGADVTCLDDDKYTPHMFSCRRVELLPVTRKLVERGSDLAYCSENGKNSSTALVVAVMHSVDHKSLEQATVLLKAGAPVDQAVGMFRVNTPLVLALRDANAPMSKLLIQHGADLATFEAMTRETFGEIQTGEMPVGPGAENMLMCLLDVFAVHDEVAAKKKTKHSPLTSSAPHFAAYYSKCSPHFPRVTQRWIELGADVTFALQWAAGQGRTADVALFLQMGADPNLGYGGGTPLLTAIPGSKATKGGPGAAASSSALATTRMLIMAGADVDTGLPQAPLVGAVVSGNIEAIKLLLGAGANKNVCLQHAGITLRLFDLADSNDGLASVLPFLAADDGSDGVVPKSCAGQFDEGVKGFGFTFTLCTQCRKRAAVLQPCSGCIMVAYCDETCQSTHWPKHKKICKKKREMQDKRSKIGKE